jgi:hypothetical protein
MSCAAVHMKTSHLQRPDLCCQVGLETWDHVRLTRGSSRPGALRCTARCGRGKDWKGRQAEPWAWGQRCDSAFCAGLIQLLAQPCAAQPLAPRTAPAPFLCSQPHWCSVRPLPLALVACAASGAFCCKSKLKCPPACDESRVKSECGLCCSAVSIDAQSLKPSRCTAAAVMVLHPILLALRGGPEVSALRYAPTPACSSTPRGGSPARTGRGACQNDPWDSCRKLSRVFIILAGCA